MKSSVLAFRGVSLTFGGLHIVHDLNFSLSGGARCGLIGPNGAGKTSVLNLITGVYPPAAGQITFGERVINDLAVHQRGRLGIGRTFQNLRLMRHLSVLENVMLGQHRFVDLGTRMTRPLMFGRRGMILRREAMAILDRLGMAGEERALAATLSYGKQKRVELARALATRPELLLLDEPAAGLNSAERTELVGALKGVLPDETALLVIEHDIDFVSALCNRVMAMNFGHLIADGLVADVCNHPDVMEAYLGRDEEVLDDRVEAGPERSAYAI